MVFRASCYKLELNNLLKIRKQITDFEIKHSLKTEEVIQELQNCAQTE